MKWTLGVVLALSLGLNALFVYSNCYGHPDVDFYQTSLGDAYFVRGRDQRAYIIEHDGHRFTAKCRASLAWPDGTNSPGKPMTDGTCIYMPSMVGKSIAAGLMRHEGDSLVYSPWANSDTEQTADILTIVDDQSH